MLATRGKYQEAFELAWRALEPCSGADGSAALHLLRFVPPTALADLDADLGTKARDPPLMHACS